MFESSFRSYGLGLVSDRCSYKLLLLQELNASTAALPHCESSGRSGTQKESAPELYAFVLFLLAMCAQAQVRITIDHNDNKTAGAEYKFTRVPSPARNDAGAKAILTLVDAEIDGTSADIGVLTDGLLPDAEDQPRRNFFLTSGTGGGRVRMDLGGVIALAQINSYSWHTGSRGPQLYRVWASDGAEPNFNAEPKAQSIRGRVAGNRSRLSIREPRMKTAASTE